MSFSPSLILYLVSRSREYIVDYEVLFCELISCTVWVESCTLPSYPLHFHQTDVKILLFKDGTVVPSFLCAIHGLIN
jgi:hypothetical protein